MSPISRIAALFVFASSLMTVAGCAADTAEEVVEDDESAINAQAGAGAIKVTGESATRLRASLAAAKVPARSFAMRGQTMTAVSVEKLRCSSTSECTFGVPRFTPYQKTVTDAGLAEKAFNALSNILIPEDPDFGGGGHAGSGDVGGRDGAPVACFQGSCTVGAGLHRVSGEQAKALIAVAGELSSQRAAPVKVSCEYHGAAQGTLSDPLFGVSKFTCTVTGGAAPKTVTDTYAAQGIFKSLEQALDTYGAKSIGAAKLYCQKTSAAGSDTCFLTPCQTGFGINNPQCDMPSGSQSALPQ